MNLKLSTLQHYCLNGLGIDLWQSQKDVVKTDASEAMMPSPKLVEQLEMLLSYRQQHVESSLTWQEVPQLTESSIVGETLKIPRLSTLFASPALKKQLWSVLVAQ